MKWTRAVTHLDALARTCAEMATRPSSIFPLRVTRLWTAGAVLEAPAEIELVTVALGVDLPVEQVPWFGEPSGAQHWASATRLAKNPIEPFWRSVRAPVWNHRIVRPVLVWDVEDGVAEENIAAIRDGRAESVRQQAPTDDELRARLDDELAVSRQALRARTDGYEDRRWKPGRLEPVADALWRASHGYLDVLGAVHGR